MPLNNPIIAPERYTAIINDENGNQVMTLRMSEFVEAVTLQTNQNIMVSGTGSPEGILSAQPFKTYLDTAAAAGSNLYVKKTGSGNIGWQLV